MSFLDPIPTMVKKARADSNMTALIASSRIHEGFPPSSPSIKGIYLHSGRSNLSQVVSSANQSTHTMTGYGRWQVDALSNESVADAVRLARVFCESVMPSVPTAGLFVINYEERNSDWDTGFMCYRATFRIECPYREWVTT